MRIAAYEHVAAATPISSLWEWRFLCISRECWSPMERLFVLKTLSRTQRATKVEKIVGICLKRLRSRFMPRNIGEKTANHSDLHAVSFLRLTHSEAPEGTQRLQWRSQGGGGGGGKRGNCPPFFQGERVGGRATCQVLPLGDEQTRRGTGYGDYGD